MHGGMPRSHEDQLGQEMQESIQANMCNMPERVSRELFRIADMVTYYEVVKCFSGDRQFTKTVTNVLT